MKIIFCVIVIIITIALINFWYQFYIIGRYYVSAGFFLTVLGALVPLVVACVAYLLITKIKKLK